MSVVISDLILNYSGAFNDDSKMSLGGSMSKTPVPDGKLDNLFDNAVDRNRRKTSRDYRCLYVQNINPTDTAYLLQASILSETDDGASFFIGTLQKNEIQKIIITEESSISSGTFKLKLNEIPTASIAWNSNLTIMESSIQLALENLSNINSVTISGASVGNERIFEIEFTDLDGYKTFSLLEVEENLLNNGSISVTSIQKGAPANGIASDIGFANQPPAYVSFVDIDTPVQMGTIGPGETTYLWFKREMSKDVSSTLLIDSFTLYLSCQS